MSVIIDEINRRLSVITALEKYTDVKLPKINTNKKQFQIRCPFHNDHTPSFTVYAVTNSWYCWAGCGGGNVINLVSKALNITYEQAKRVLIKDLRLDPVNLAHAIDSGELKIQGSLKEFYDNCGKYADALSDLKRIYEQEALTIEDLTSMEQKADVYHNLSKIDYFEPLIRNGSVEDRIYAMRRIGEMINDANKQFN
ncbi:CHC2 zinc finger domain-containing protein [Neobacillus sp. PS2-9]|uniref:CHC2 zinc finger domain-containing protein n=1 Tax=Neobacillus sp. PS2-9 TaxID=3070676 RepID=UPI0027E02733|nr:CHC2 zinc finger domain-containing protein [Neobacillus sp. PS2-9]WML56671.1 CHC2 zinc finger domain-containing protein [Neobacillus sp. PS2-9]